MKTDYSDIKFKNNGYRLKMTLSLITLYAMFANWIREPMSFSVQGLIVSFLPHAGPLCPGPSDSPKAAAR